MVKVLTFVSHSSLILKLVLVFGFREKLMAAEADSILTLPHEHKEVGDVKSCW